MDQEQHFVTLRYFLVEEGPVLFEPRPLPAIKGDVVLDAVKNERDWLKRGVRYAFIGISRINPSINEEFPSERFLVGKIAKYRTAQVGERVPGDVIEHTEDDWIALLVIIDPLTQTIYARKDWRFGTPEQICSAIESGFRKHVLATYNHKIFVEPKPTEGTFWEIIESHSKIYRLELRLVSPNILQTNVNAREALSALQELYGQDEISLRMKNDSGFLKVPKAPTSDYVEYIEKGEGTWRATTEGKRGGKKSHSSADAAETIELKVPDEPKDDGDVQLSIEPEKEVGARRERGRFLISQVFRIISARRDR